MLDPGRVQQRLFLGFVLHEELAQRHRVVDMIALLAQLHDDQIVLVRDLVAGQQRKINLVAQIGLGSAVLTSKLIDGTFPDYNRVIPTANDKELVVDKKEFEQAVDRVSTVSSERGRAVKLSGATAE